MLKVLVLPIRLHIPASPEQICLRSEAFSNMHRVFKHIIM